MLPRGPRWIYCCQSKMCICQGKSIAWREERHLSKNGTELHKCLVCPHVDFAVAAWASIDKGVRLMEKVQHECLRQIAVEKHPLISWRSGRYLQYSLNQKEMATYRHWSVSLWRDPDNVTHCRILSPDKTEWRLILATLSADEDAVSWLTNYGSWHTYEKKKKKNQIADTGDMYRYKRIHENSM